MKSTEFILILILKTFAFCVDIILSFLIQLNIEILMLKSNLSRQFGFPTWTKALPYINIYISNAQLISAVPYLFI